MIATDQAHYLGYQIHSVSVHEVSKIDIYKFMMIFVLFIVGT